MIKPMGVTSVQVQSGGRILQSSQVGIDMLVGEGDDSYSTKNQLAGDDDYARDRGGKAEEVRDVVALTKKPTKQAVQEMTTNAAVEAIKKSISTHGKAKIKTGGKRSKAGKTVRRRIGVRSLKKEDKYLRGVSSRTSTASSPLKSPSKLRVTKASKASGGLMKPPATEPLPEEMYGYFSRNCLPLTPKSIPKAGVH